MKGYCVTRSYCVTKLKNLNAWNIPALKHFKNKDLVSSQKIAVVQKCFSHQTLISQRSTIKTRSTLATVRNRIFFFVITF
jgi:hypothetical protein